MEFVFRQMALWIACAIAYTALYTIAVILNLGVLAYWIWRAFMSSDPSHTRSSGAEAENTERHCYKPTIQFMDANCFPAMIKDHLLTSSQFTVEEILPELREHWRGCKFGWWKIQQEFSQTRDDRSLNTESYGSRTDIEMQHVLVGHPRLTADPLAGW